MNASVPVWRWGDSFAPLRRLLRRGGILAVPTESSYGLAVDPTSEEAVAGLRRFKSRPAGEPFPVVGADREQLVGLGVDLGDPALARLAALWPAALTLVAPVAAPLPAGGLQSTLGVRVPDHLSLRELLARTGPLTATSANRRGEPPVLDPALAAHLLAGADAIVVDGGRLPGGRPSTVVAVRDGSLEVLRAGRVPAEALHEAALA